MGGNKFCCVLGCTTRRTDGVTIHKFPNPEMDLLRFTAWVQAVGGNLPCLDNNYVYEYLRICHKHFEPRYWTRGTKLSIIAIPTLLMKAPLEEVTNENKTLETRSMQETVMASKSTYTQETATASTSNLKVNKSQIKARRTRTIIILKKAVKSFNTVIEGKDEEPGGPTTLLVDDQPRVRDGEIQREKPPHTTESARGASRPPHTSTHASRDDFRPIHHRGWRGGSLHTTTLPGTSMPQPGPSGTGSLKRARPDDTASPSTLQEDAKCVRVHSAQGELRTWTRATMEIPARLAVAICFPPPSRDLTKEEAEQVTVGLEDLLMGTDSTKPLPAFRGYSRVAEGNVHLWCEDDYALAWLTQNVPLLKLPNTDLTLTVLRQSDVPTCVNASLFVPRYRGDLERLHRILIRQNTWYDIARWSLYRATTVGGDNYGTYLTLGVPSEEVVKVLGRERRISYLLGSIYVRFWPTTQPSDGPDDTDSD